MDAEKLIEEAKALSNEATPGPWRASTVHAAEEVWAACPGEIGGWAGERLLLRLNPNFTREEDTAFIARSRMMVPELAAALRETTARADRATLEALELKQRGRALELVSEDTIRRLTTERDEIAAANVAANKRIETLQHERDAARAELARLTTPRPIAEAPRDGTWVLCKSSAGWREGQFCGLNFDPPNCYGWFGRDNRELRRVVEFLPLPAEKAQP